MNRADLNSRSASAQAFVARMGSWRPSLVQIACIYALGFLFCWTSLWIGLGQHGQEPFVSPLYGFLLLFEEALRDVLNRFPSLRPTFYPPSLTAIPVLLACAFVAEIFATGAALLRSAHKPLRWGGVTLLVILAFATFSWSPIPPLPQTGILVGSFLLPVAWFFTIPY